MMRCIQTIQNPKSKIQNPSGQSILEFAISFVGLIMFIYVLLNVWVWLNSIMVERQRAFQHSRLAAGQAGTAGVPVGYVRPPIKLVGLASSPGGDALPPGLGLVIGDPPCTAAEPFFQQALSLANEAKAIADNEIPPVAARLEQRANELKTMAEHCAGLRRRSQQNCFRAVPPLQARVEETRAELQNLTDQVQAKHDQAQQLVDQGRAACP